MRRFIPALALAAVVSAASAALPAAPRPELAERWSTRGDPRVLEFGAITGMAEGGDGRVWIADDIAHRVVTVDPSGRSMTLAARTGDGPGEVQGPSLAAPAPGGGVAIYDMGHYAVEWFDGSGRFLRRVPLSTGVVNPKGFAVLRGGAFVLSGGIEGRRGAIHRFAADGRLERSWHPLPDARDPRAALLAAGGALSAAGERILFSQAAPHRIVSYGPTGGGGRVVAADRTLLKAVGDEFITERNGRRTFRWYFPRSTGIFSLPGGRVLNVVTDRERDRSTWEVYGADGRLLGRSRYARAYWAWSIARNGDVLASYLDPETQESVAVRLRVTIP